MKNFLKSIPAIIIFLLIFSGVQAQNTKTVNGIVLDSITRQPVSNVNISVDQSSGTTTDEHGRFSLNIRKRDRVMVLSHLSYLHKTIDLSQTKIQIDTILLKPKIIELPTFELSTKNYVSVKQTEAIMDYAITGDLVVLLLHINGKTALEFHDLYNPASVLFRQLIPFKANSLFTDFFYQVHLMADDSVRQLHVDDNKNISFYSAVSRKHFDQVMGNTLAITSKNIITVESNTFSQQYDYYLIGIDSAYRKCFFKIYDKQKQREIAQRYGEMSAVQSVYNIILDYYNVTPEMSEDPGQRKVSLNLFQKKAVFKNISKSSYNPVFVRNNSIFVFDLVNNQLCIFDKTGQKLKSVMISFNLEQGFRKIIQSYLNGDFYCYKMTNGTGYISRMDTETGKILPYIRISDGFFPEDIQIKDKTIFYLAKSTFDLGRKLFWLKPALTN